MTYPYKRFTAVNQAKVVQVVEIKSLTGEGVPGDPIIEITEYYSLEGERLARYIPGVTDLSNGEWAKETSL